MAHITGRTFELYLHFRQPEFLRTARLDQWDGHVLLAPRQQLDEALARKETKRPGVYFLRSESRNRPKIYIGSAEASQHRIRSHDHQEWWEQLVVVSATGTRELNTADASYLESKLAKRARDAGRVDLHNAKVPPQPRLSESDQARMNHFFNEALLIFPMLRIDDFVDYAPTEQPSTDDSQMFHLTLPGNLGEAFAVYYPATRKMVVLAGSNARREWVGTSRGNDGPKKRHAQLLRDGILVLDGDRCRFAQDCEFAAVSTAAKVVAGAPRSGTYNWKIPGQTTTLREWLQARKLHSPRDDS